MGNTIVGVYIVFALRNELTTQMTVGGSMEIGWGELSDRTNGIKMLPRRRNRGTGHVMGFLSAQGLRIVRPLDSSRCMAFLSVSTYLSA